MSETTFENAKVGDKVWSVEFGWVTITFVSKDVSKDGYVNVDYPDYGRSVKFDLNGRRFDRGLHQYNKNQALFWDEIKIVAPERPKRKVIKTAKCYGVYDKDGMLFNTFRDKDSAEYYVKAYGRFVVKLTGTYEVEE